VKIARGTHNVRQKSDVALLLIDVINHFEFDDGPQLLAQASRVAPNIARLKERAQRARVPVVYVNDNFGEWRSDTQKLLRYCLRPEALGREFVKMLLPDDRDYFVLKPMHSAFYFTPLDILLREFGSSLLILAGLATHSCIICTAHDAEMRHFQVVVPSDCSAARSPGEHRQALDHIRTMGNARVLESANLRQLRRSLQTGTS